MKGSFASTSQGTATGTTLVRFLSGALKTAVLIAVSMSPAIAVGLEVQGTARVVDGDTLNVEGLGVRLHGIDAPETAQTCKDAAGADYPCGERAARRLRALAEGRRVACDGREFDQYKRLVAVCRVDTTELNRTMVAQGHAWAFVRFSQDYAEVEREARAAKRGVFAASNMPPWEFRSGAWGAVSAPRADCPIKGNVSRSGERIYHMPWQRDYARIKMDEGTGKRWFCNENEATAAGWRKAARQARAGCSHGQT